MRVQELFETPQDDLIKLLKQHCPKNLRALSSGAALPLYRGLITEQWTNMDDGYQFMVSPSRDEPRKSRTGVNLFLNFATHSPLWKGIPNRSLSSSCTTDFDAAKSFGGAWLIIPFDNVHKFAVSKNDFNFIKPDGNRTLMGYAAAMRGVARDIFNVAQDIRSGETKLYPDEVIKIIGDDKSVGLKITNFSMEQLEELSSTIQKLSELFHNKKFDTKIGLIKTTLMITNRFADLVDSITLFDRVFKGLSLMEWMKKHVTPEIVGVKVVDSYASIAPASPSPEIWFEGRYIGLKASNASLEKTDEIAQSSWLKNLNKQVNG